MDDRLSFLLLETTALLKLFLINLSTNFLQETMVLFTLGGGYLLVIGVIRSFSERAGDRFSLRFAGFVLAVVAYGLTIALLSRAEGVEILYLLKAVFYVEVLRSLVNVVTPHLRVGNSYLFTLKLSILSGGIFLFLQDIARGESPPVLRYGELGFKLSSALLLTLALVGLYRTLLGHLSEGFVNRILRRSGPILLLFYLVVTLGWVFGTVKLSQDFVVKFALMAGVLIGYFSLQVYAVSLIDRIFGEEFPSLKGSLRKFLMLFALFILYRGVDLLFTLEALKSQLDSLYLINTELVKISLLSILESLYVFALLWTLTGFLKNLVYAYYMSRGKEIEAGSFRALVSNVGILLAFSIALIQLGITWKVMVPLAGALGIGLGFGLQTIFNNYVSGFILLLSKNIKVGDLVEVEGSAGYAIGRQSETIFGKVVNINILTTVIRTNDNVEIAIPNSEFISGRIINYSLSDPYIRVRIPFGVSYSSDPEKVKAILLKVAEESPLVLKEPPPGVWFYEMGDSALIFYLLVWVDIRRFWRMRAPRSEIYFRAWKELKKEGVEIPFPQRDVWFKNPLRVEIDERGIPEGGSEGS
ncbi:mechanosensitive ion channel domain-containing protein [Hydrogenivirga sp. 128-5-R1-1]|uniref:mechanosensitive ion channel family protein n=1 Tax=Hydrogenivirga sp. 128-5-R1-1 TaxID=392423 RepID=UPI00015F0C12|nr:mechanosensitive ion channel domain-containing protein [Hydrogenivirga sp. 128-5-R1-1]EDP75874.1 hypothetical protein HG1285_06095 [Hydrogenivirga sp. 128-5-R1-1]